MNAFPPPQHPVRRRSDQHVDCVTLGAAGQADRLLDRATDESRPSLRATLANPLAIRLPGFDPTRLLAALHPWTSWMFCRWCVRLCLAVCCGSLALVTVRFDELVSRLPHLGDFFSVHNLAWLAVAVAIARTLHELAHALACKHYGGECRELGPMLLLLTPCLYANACDARLITQPRHRIAVRAAGIYIELLLAALCTLVWWATAPSLLNTICLNLMIVCAVGTLAFNGNPLLRFDGYWILSDALAVPNLQQQATRQLQNVIARVVYGEWPTDLTHEDRERRVFLFLYALASRAYRLFLVTSILWIAHRLLKPYGLASLTFVLVGVFTAGNGSRIFRCSRRIVARCASLRQRRRRRSRVVAVLICAGCLLTLVLPLPRRITVPAVIEPAGARSVRVPIGGRLRQVVEVGEQIEKGTPLAVLANAEIRRDLIDLHGQVAQQQKHVQNLKRQRPSEASAIDQLPAAEQRLERLQSQLFERQQAADRLTITAPISGEVLPPTPGTGLETARELGTWLGSPLAASNLGCHLPTGTMLCRIGNPEQLAARLSIDPSAADQIAVGQRVHLQTRQSRADIISGRIVDLTQIDADEIAKRADRRKRRRAVSVYVEAQVELDPQLHPPLIGAAGRARILLPPESIASRSRRYWRNALRRFW